MMRVPVWLTVERMRALRVVPMVGDCIGSLVGEEHCSITQLRSGKEFEVRGCLVLHNIMGEIMWLRLVRSRVPAIIFRPSAAAGNGPAD